MLNPDALNNADVGLTANAAMAVIDRLQDFTPEVQMLAMTASFVLLAQRHKQRPSDLFVTADNVINGAEGKRPEFAAVAHYLENET